MDKNKKIKDNFYRKSHEKNFYERAESELNNIIQLLILNQISFDEKMFLNQLNEYLNKYHRILYSCFSHKVFEWSKDKDNNYTGNAIVNLQSMVDKINIEEITKNDEIIFKIFDHMQLAIHQVEMMELNDDKINPYLNKALKEVDNKINIQARYVTNMKNSVKKDIETQKDSLLSQMIAIVAIFVGISFVMFGGMSLINDLFTHIDGQPVPLVELICLGCLIGIVMIIVMYCFIMFILSVTRNRMLRAKKIFFRIVQKSCTILGLVSCTMFIIWCCQTFLK